MIEKPPLWIICDISGSMHEGGKRMLMRNLLTYLLQLEQIFPDNLPFGGLEVIEWGESAQPVELDSDYEVRPFQCAGKTSASALVSLLTQPFEPGSQPRLLLFSDGNWDRDELGRLMEWRRLSPGFMFRIIAVGSDANIQKLRQLAGDLGAFLPEEVTAAWQSFSWTDFPTGEEAPLNPLLGKEAADE